MKRSHSKIPPVRAVDYVMLGVGVVLATVAVVAMITGAFKLAERILGG